MVKATKRMLSWLIAKLIEFSQSKSTISTLKCRIEQRFPERFEYSKTEDRLDRR